MSLTWRDVVARGTGDPGSLMTQAGRSLTRGSQQLTNLGEQFRQGNILEQQEQEADNLAKFRQFASGMDSDQLGQLQQSGNLDPILQRFGVDRASAFDALNQTAAQNRQREIQDYNFQRARTEDEQQDTTFQQTQDQYAKSQDFEAFRDTLGATARDIVAKTRSGDLTVDQGLARFEEVKFNIPRYENFEDEATQAGLFKAYADQIKTAQDLAPGESNVLNSTVGGIEAEVQSRRKAIEATFQNILQQNRNAYETIKAAQKVSGSPNQIAMEALRENAQAADLDITDLVGEGEEINNAASKLVSQFEKLKKENEDFFDLPIGVLQQAAKSLNFDSGVFGVSDLGDEEVASALTNAAVNYKENYDRHQEYVKAKGVMDSTLQKLNRLQAQKVREVTSNAKSKRAAAKGGSGFNSPSDLFDYKDFNKKLDQYIAEEGTAAQGRATNAERTAEALRVLLGERRAPSRERQEAASSASPFNLGPTF